MKKLTYLILASLVLAGCEKQLKTYDGKNVVYFLYGVSTKDDLTGITDTTNITFAYKVPSFTDSVLIVPVQATGEVSAVDRKYRIAVADSSTAKEGVHYDFVNTDLTIPAGKVRDTIYVKLHRTPDMAVNTLVLHLVLQPNEYFGTDMPDKLVTGTTYARSTYYRIKVDDILAKPKYWLDTYLGVFTRKKLLLMQVMLDIPLDKFNTTSVTIAEEVYYGKFMQRYFNEQKAAGTPILEDDGTEMIMGPSSQ